MYVRLLPHAACQSSIASLRLSNMGHNSVLGLYCHHIDLILRFKRQNTFTQPIPSGAAKKTQEKRVEDSTNARCFTQDRLTRQGLSCLVIQLPRQDPAGAGSGAGRGGQMKCRARQSSAHTTQSSCGAGRGCAPHARPGRHQLERRCGAGAAHCCAAAVVTSRGGRRRLWS